MNKEQTIHAFWNSFGVKAYDEHTVPDDAVFPRITYTLATDSLNNVVNMNANIWYRSTSWEGATNLCNEIAKRIKEHGHQSLPFDGGYIYLCGGTPFAQRMDEPSDDMIKRYYINVQVEYLCAY